MPTSPGNKHLSIRFFIHIPRLFHLSTENLRLNPSEMHIKVLFHAPTQKSKKLKAQKIFLNWKKLEKNHR